MGEGTDITEDADIDPLGSVYVYGLMTVLFRFPQKKKIMTCAVSLGRRRLSTRLVWKSRECGSAGTSGVPIIRGLIKEGGSSSGGLVD